MTASPSFITRLKALLSEETWPWIFAALRQDSLIWESLQEADFGERALARASSRPEDWSPTALALLALDIPRPSAPAALPEPLRLRARQTYESKMAEADEAKAESLTLAEAALLALAMYETYAENGSWEILTTLISASRLHLWKTPLSCLYGLATEPANLLEALLRPAVLDVHIDLAIHVFLSQPSPPAAQIEALSALLVGWPLQECKRVLARLTIARPSLAVEVGRRLLNNYPTPRPISGESRPIQFENLTQLLQLADLNALSILPTRAASLRSQALQGAQRLQSGIFCEVVEDTARTGDVNNALTAWKSGLTRLIESGISPKTISPPPGLIYALLEADRPNEVLTLLSKEETKSPEEAEAAYLFAVAQQAVTQGNLARAAEFARHTFNALNRQLRGGTDGKKDLCSSAPMLDQQAPVALLQRLSRLLLNAFLPAEALRAARLAAELQPNNPDILMILAEAQRAAGDPMAAVAANHLAVALMPTNTTWRRALSENLEAAGDWRAALQERETLLEPRFAPPSARSWPLLSDLRALAACALHADQLQRAIAACQQTLQMNPEDGLAHAILGEALDKNGATSQAMSHFRQATQLAPHQAGPWLAMARTQQRAGEATRAIETLRSAAQAIPNDPLINLTLAEAYLEQNAFTPAANILRDAHALLPKQARTQTDNELAAKITLRLGQTLHRLGRLKEARQVLGESYQARPAYPGLAYTYAQTLLALDETAEALPPLTAALQAEPADASPYLDYANALLKTYAATADSRPEARLSLTEAVRAARRALELAPDASSRQHILAKALLAEALAASNQPEEALPAYYRALETELANEPQWYSRLSHGLGRTALKLGQPETAIAALQEAIRTEPRQTQVHRTLAETYFSINLPEESFAAARAALQSAPDDVETLRWFAEHAMLTNEPGEAVQALTRAIQLDPTNLSLVARLAQVRAKTGEALAAQETYKQVIAAKNPTPEDLRQAAEGLLTLGDVPNAIACLERALSLLPSPDATLLSQLANVYRQDGKPERALEYLDHAISLEPNNVGMYLCRAYLLASLNRLQAAQASLEHALNLRPDDPYIHYRLATILRAVGNLPQAMTHAEQAVNLLHKDLETKNALNAVLAARVLAAELASARLDCDYARTFGVEVDSEQLIQAYRQASRNGQKPEGAACPSSERVFFTPENPVIPYLCLFAEMALEISDETPAAKALEIAARFTDNGQPPPPHPRLLALQARLAFRHGDLAGGEQTLRAAIDAFQRQQSETSALSHPSTASHIAIALAATHLHQWDTALKLLKEAAEAAPLEPFLHLKSAAVLVMRAEYKQTCRELDIITHAPSEEALSESAYQAFTQAMQATYHCFPPDEQSALEKTHLQISRWRIRGQAIFRPGSESLQAINSLQDTPDDLAARVAALYYADELSAITQLRKAHAGSKMLQRPRIMIQLAIAVGFKGRRTADLGEAMGMMRTLVEQYPSYPIPHYLMANLAHRAGNLETAVQAVKTALSIWPDEPRWHNFQGRLMVDAGQPDDAIACVRQAIQLEPTYLSHYLVLGDAHIQKREIPQAIKILEEALHLAPDQVDPYLALARVYLYNNDLAKATISAERAITLSPGQSSPLLLRAEIALEAQDPRGALNRAQAALRINQDDVDALDVASRALCRLGRIPDALAHIEKAISLAADPLPHLLKRVKLLEKSQGKEVAFAALQELATQYPREPSVLAPLARLFAETGHEEAAIRAAQLAFQAEHFDLNVQDATRLHGLLANLLRKSGHLDQAIHEYSEAIRLMPGEVEIYLELGDLYQERRQHVQALQTYQRAIAIAPLDYRPYYQAGMALKESRDYPGAERMLRRAAELARDNVTVHRTLAAVTALKLIHERQSSPAEARPTTS